MVHDVVVVIVVDNNVVIVAINAIDRARHISAAAIAANTRWLR